MCTAMASRSMRCTISGRSQDSPASKWAGLLGLRAFGRHGCLAFELDSLSFPTLIVSVVLPLSLSRLVVFGGRCCGAPSFLFFAFVLASECLGFEFVPVTVQSSEPI